MSGALHFEENSMNLGHCVGENSTSRRTDNGKRK